MSWHDKVNSEVLCAWFIILWMILTPVLMVLGIWKLWEVCA